MEENEEIRKQARLSWWAVLGLGRSNTSPRNQPDRIDRRRDLKARKLGKIWLIDGAEIRRINPACYHSWRAAIDAMLPAPDVPDRSAGLGGWV